MLTKLYGYIAGLGAIIIAALAALGLAKRAGKKEEQAAETAKSLEQAKESNAIDTEVHNLSQSDLDDRLRLARRPPSNGV